MRRGIIRAAFDKPEVKGVSMKAWIQVAAILLVLWCLPPASLRAEGEAAQIIFRDDQAGYVLPLPVGWQEVTDTKALDSLVRRLCSIFMTGDRIANANHLRGAILPGDQKASPALVVFSLDYYSSLGLSIEAVKDIAKEPQVLMASLANSIQQLYLQHFPQSILINHRLGDDFFVLTLRTVLDFADEPGTTRNRYIKMMVTSTRLLVLMTLYDGPTVTDYEVVIAKCVREMLVLSDRSIDKVNLHEVTPLDYVLVILALLVAVIVIRKFRAFMRR